MSVYLLQMPFKYIPVILTSTELNCSRTEKLFNNENIILLLRKRSDLFDVAFELFSIGPLIDLDLMKHQMQSRVNLIFLPWESRNYLHARLELYLDEKKILLYETLHCCITIDYEKGILDIVIYAISSGSKVAWDIKITMRFYLKNTYCSVFYFSPRNHLTDKAWININNIKEFKLLFDTL